MVRPAGAEYRVKVTNENKNPQGLKPLRTLLFWLGWLDSNQHMADPETAALPFGYTPLINGRDDRI